MTRESFCVFNTIREQKTESPFSFGEIGIRKRFKIFFLFFRIFGSSPKMKKAYNSIWLEYQLDKLEAKGSSPFKLRQLQNMV